MKEIISISILSIFLYICFKLMLQSVQIEYKENLTMEENPIKITIDNYCGQKITFTMSEDADVETMFWLDDSSKRVTDIRIKAHDEEILINKEDLPA